MKRKHSDKELTELQVLKNEIKKLKKENSRLRKQFDRKAHLYENERTNKEADEEIERDKFLVPETPQYEVCPYCSRRGIEDIVIYDRLFHTCIHCKYRSKAIIIGIPK